MRVLDAWPMGTAFQCDFVDRTRWAFAPGERCIDFQMDLADLPPTGILVIHERTVRDMATMLGWKIEDPHVSEELLPIIALNEALHEENQALRKALSLAAKKPTDIPRVMAG